MGLWCWCLSLLILGTVCVQTVQSQKSKTDKAKPGCPAAPEESLQDVQKNISALWQEVGKLQQPVHVHIHGDGHMMDGHHDHANHSDDHHDDHHGQHGDNLDDHHDDHHSDHHGDHHAHHVQHDDPKADKSKSKKKADKKKDDKMMPGKGMPDDDDDDDDDDGHTDHKHPVNASRTAHHGHHSEDSHHDPDGTHVHIHLHMGPDEAHHMHESHSTETLHARCNVEPNKNLTASQRQDVKGTIYLQQKHGKSLEAKVDLKGFDHSHGGKDPGEHAHLHGLHVHEYGDMKYGCNSLGGHFNPSKAKHGGPKDKHSHAGDWGNLHVDEDGTINTILADQIPRTIGISNILGRGIVIHADADDLGKQNSTASITTGSAGLRLACCIVVATEEPPGIWV